MIFPILMILGGFITVRAVVHHVQGPSPKTKVGGVSQTQRLTKREALIRLAKKSPNLFKLMAKLKRGEAIDPWLVNSAMREAYDRGDIKTVAKLHHKFGTLKVRQIADESELDESEDEAEAEEPDEDEAEAEAEEVDGENGRDHDHEADGEYMPDGDPDDGTNIVVGKESITVEGEEESPLEGISSGMWEEFVSRMETQAPTFAGPNHVGRFHQSKMRLRQLGIDDVAIVGDSAKQLDAFTRDIEDLRERGEPLIRAWECRPIKIGEGEQVATLSGILAVLKSAGIEKARSWFESETDRAKFAKTTEMFTKANGAF